MQRYIAFLRAINVGGHTVKMEHLRKLFEAQGFANVATFIASGNVIFETQAKNTQTLEQQIEAHLQQSLGYEVSTLIRSTSELAAVARYQPFPAAEPDAENSSLYIMFLRGPLSSEAQHKLMTLRTAIDDFHVHEREVYWLCRKKFSDSLVNTALLAKTINMPSTTRNVTTVRKLAAKYAAAPK
jgi:uncharacterized protein (DUF1697 family)